MIVVAMMMMTMMISMDMIQNRHDDSDSDQRVHCVYCTHVSEKGQDTHALRLSKTLRKCLFFMK